MSNIDTWPSSYEINYSTGCLHCGRRDTTLFHYTCNGGCVDDGASEKDRICLAVPGIWRNNGGRIESIVHDDMPPVVVAIVGEVNNQTRKDTATANRIVHACNLHDELVEALTGLVNIATHPKATKADIRMIAGEARAVLAKCEKGE